MRRAIALSEESVSRGGGPFGAVIAQAGRIVAEASNSVTIDNDPTAHAEVNCIRQAATHLGTFDLSARFTGPGLIEYIMPTTERMPPVLDSTTTLFISKCP